MLSQDRISPPPSKRRKTNDGDASRCENDVQLTSPVPVLPSPVQLTRIDDLPDTENVDTVQLQDLLGDPLISECWQFNFLFDVDFVMRHFDPDIRTQIPVKIVHGSWRQEDGNRTGIENAQKRWPNVEQIRAWLPDPFGTHHSKMMVIFRMDDTMQIVIHTSNMIPQDWSYFTQAVWTSPHLALSEELTQAGSTIAPKIGSGTRFKLDFLSYLRSYGVKLDPLSTRIKQYDFSSIKAALISSTPGDSPLDGESKLRGLPALQRILSNIDCSTETATPRIVAQVSSIASLGTGNAWLSNFFSKLRTSSTSGLSHSSANLTAGSNIVFPTVSEIRDGLAGYMAGSSIHLKIQTSSQQQQLQHLRPHLHRWSGDANDTKPEAVRNAGRRTVAPHIKTFMRFSDASCTTIDWAILTSANLSQQAWGRLAKDGKVKVASYEIGVVVWPALYDIDDKKTVMIPTFKQDLPANHAKDGFDQIIALRMPYDLPLVPYSATDTPWSPSGVYSEPDWLGNTWP